LHVGVAQGEIERVEGDAVGVFEREGNEIGGGAQRRVFEPALVLVVVVEGFFDPEPVTQASGGVLEDLELVGSDPAADVVGAGVFGAVEDDVAIGN
jgi:hypothetical protein